MTVQVSIKLTQKEAGALWVKCQNMKEEIKLLKSVNKELAEAIITSLRGSVFDENGNRNDDGLLQFKETQTATKALLTVEPMCNKILGG